MTTSQLITPLRKWKFSPCNTAYCTWANCNGQHLVVLMPGGLYLWDIDSRGLNCAEPNDRYHRCWIRWGELPFITVNKDGSGYAGNHRTCSAGGGSILTPSGWHGFLRNGNFIEESL